MSQSLWLTIHGVAAPASSASIQKGRRGADREDLRGAGRILIMDDDRIVLEVAGRSHAKGGLVVVTARQDEAAAARVGKPPRLGYAFMP